eukprot:TRINITY_DN2625_c0_g3_i1.p1 TRINITY_DN2625_c0_g3~~TRINITY_DN2625_c0_g3_i1.p1  ORF type:complete len:1721 (+),score=746.57 TRINITY_DN2625_c0_g3_i1:2414-7576(+)
MKKLIKKKKKKNLLILFFPIFLLLTKTCGTLIALVLKDLKLKAKEINPTMYKKTFWEEKVIPHVLKFMQQQKYMPLEMEDSIEKIRIALNEGNEVAAKEIVTTILGEEFRLPRVAEEKYLSSKPSFTSPLSSKDIKVGLHVYLSPNFSNIVAPSPSSSLSSSSLSSLSLSLSQPIKITQEKRRGKEVKHLKGVLGKIVSIDYISERALVEFYESERGVLEGWWFHFHSLILSPYQSPNNNNNNSTINNENEKNSQISSLQQKLSQTKQELSHLYARESILHLLLNTSLSVDEASPFNFKKMLNILSQQNLSCHSFESTYLLSSMSLSEQKLMDLYLSLPTQISKTNFSNLLVNECTNLFKKSSNFVCDKSLFIKSEVSQIEKERKIEIPGSKTLLITFHKDSFIPPQQNATITFFKQQNSSDPIKVIETSGKNLLPFVISQDHFYISVKSPPKNNVKYSFSVTPAHPDLSLAIWLTQFLLYHPVLPVKPKLSLLFNSILQCCFSMKYLSAQKEAILNLLSQLMKTYTLGVEEEKKEMSEIKEKEEEMDTSEDNNEEALLSIEKLEEEVENLYQSEKSKANFFHSVYFQTLAEFIVWYYIYKEKLSPSEVKVEEQLSSGSMDLGISIELVKAMLGKTKVEEPPKEEKKDEKEIKGEEKSEPLQLLEEEKKEEKQVEEKKEEKQIEEKKEEKEEEKKEEKEEQKKEIFIPFEPKKEEEHYSDENQGDEDIDFEDEQLRQAILLSQMEDENHVVVVVDNQKNPPKNEQKEIPPQKEVFSSPRKEQKEELPIQKESPPQQKELPKQKEEKSPLIIEKKVKKSPTLNKEKKEENKLSESFLKSLPKKMVQNKKQLWMNQLIETSYLLECIVHPQQYKNILIKNLKSFWQIKNESILERMVIVQNIPKLSLQKQNNIKQTLCKSLRRFTNLEESNIFLPLNENEKTNFPFCIITLPNPSLLPTVISKLESAKIKTKRVSKTLKVGRVDQAFFIDNLSSLQERNSDTKTLLYLFLQSKLVSSTNKHSLSVSSSFAKALLSLFLQFTGKTISKKNLLSFPNQYFISKKQFDSLYFHANNTHLKEEEINHIFSKHKNKENNFKTEDLSLFTEEPFQKETILDQLHSKTGKEEESLSFVDFVFYFDDCAKENPLETWRLLSKLGFDYNVDQSCFNDLEDAYQSLLLFSPKKGRRIYDEHIISYAQEISNQYGYSLSNLPLDLLFPLSSQYTSQYKLLLDLTIPALRLRFSLIKHFNSCLEKVLPLINMYSSFDGSISDLLSKSRDLIFLSVKTNFSLIVFDKTSTSGNQPTVVIERLNLLAGKNDSQSNKSNNENKDDLLNNTSFGLAMQQLSKSNDSVLRQKKPPGTEPHFSFVIEFKGENVEGQGGPYRQFYSDVSRELKDRLPLLIPCPNAQIQNGDNRDKFIISPSATSSQDLNMFEFFGKLIGISMRTGVLLTLDLPSFFWKSLVGVEVTEKNLQEIDIFSKTTYSPNVDENEWEETPRYWGVVLSDKTKVELVENGFDKLVSFEDRKKYCELALKTRLKESEKQMKYILKGFHSIVPSNLMNMWTWKDIQMRVCGSPFIDVQLLKRHTKYSGLSSKSPVVEWFWNTLSEMNQEQLRRFIRFSWAQERLPTDDEDFKRNGTRMLIKSYVSNSPPDQVFPKADTCFFNLILPNYSSQKVLKEKLLTSIYIDIDSMDSDVQEDQEEENLGLGRRSNLFGGFNLNNNF